LETSEANDDSNDDQGPKLDTCEAYRLLQDAGKIVNLADWFNTFEVAVPTPVIPLSSRKRRRRSTPAEDKGATDEETAERRTQARFIRSVSELGFLGIIGPTKRKTEHVARVVW